MLKFLKSLVGITLVVILGYALYNMATQRANDSLKTLRVAADNTVTVIGTVVENKNDCFEQSSGSKCFLGLKVAEKEVYVIYNTNDSSFCQNEEAAIAGKSVRIGATIKVFGYYRQDTDSDTILTCPSKAYSIEVQ